MAKKPQSRSRTHHDDFIGVIGAWGNVAKFGVTGCVAATMMYGLLWVLPQQQTQYMEMLRQDRANSLLHGEKAVDKISNSINDNTKALMSLLDNQKNVRGNQEQLILSSEAMVELLRENVRAAKKTAGMPEE